MNFNQFYENIILRDVIEFFTPGVIFLSGLILLCQSLTVVLGLGSLLSLITTNNSLLISVILIVVAYTIGHFITGISALIFRTSEFIQAKEVLSKDALLKTQVVTVIANYIDVSPSEVVDLLERPRDASNLRELLRMAIQHHMPGLHKEFVVRLSILSRFLQNMCVATGSLLFFLSLTTAVLWGKFIAMASKFPFIVYPMLAIVLFFGVMGIYIFSYRSRTLRQTMIRYTFQIAYVDYLETKKKESGHVQNNEPQEKFLPE